jgi:hypothetical protein
MCGAKLPPEESPLEKGPKYAPPSLWACAGRSAKKIKITAAQSRVIKDAVPSVCFMFDSTVRF